MNQQTLPDAAAAGTLLGDLLLPQEGGRMTIGDNVWIGAGAVIVGNVRIGEGAIIGAAARVDFDVPAYAVVAGNPARIVASQQAKR